MPTVPQVRHPRHQLLMLSRHHLLLAGAQYLLLQSFVIFPGIYSLVEYLESSRLLDLGRKPKTCPQEELDNTELGFGEKLFRMGSFLIAL